MKSRPSKPLEMLSVSHDASQNPKVSMPKRPVSASRGRVTTVNSTRSSSSNEKPRPGSCSPPRVRAPISSSYKTGSKILSRSRNGDDVNPIIMGTQMVDRVVNMRKLPPPKRDEYPCHENTKKSSHENSGFGRSLSKKSLDMAMRHMVCIFNSRMNSYKGVAIDIRVFAQYTHYTDVCDSTRCLKMSYLRVY